MSLIKWTPRSTELSPFVGNSMLNDIDQFINSFFNENVGFIPKASPSWIPAFDVIEKEKKCEIRVEAPGMEKSDFAVSVKDGLITISGDKKIDHSDNKDGCTYRESSEGRFSRSFRLPETVNEKKVGATYKDGVLTISVPRSKPVEANKLKIEVK